MLFTSKPLLVYTVKDDFAVKKLDVKYELSLSEKRHRGESVTEGERDSAAAARG